MQGFASDRLRDEVILVARILLVLLFLIFGWGKITGFSGTVGYMAHSGLPLPWAAAIIAIVIEVFVSIALVIGVYTRPLALVMAIYTLATAFIGHPYWTMSGTAHFEAEINFFKNVSIIGGFLLLYVTGPGRYALRSTL
ncbi:MAG TPA: DoxX family protein [Acidisoma sp.]|uniref:DoxX family protein n=1 Tax=Acidisoma sp. TaxID=1872115 RepID=UPI002C2B7208|nr:DoxX family protein [Acidisoma sp.]HTI03385.1 DoxX family protein [Acidisoma sp.]